MTLLPNRSVPGARLHSGCLLPIPVLLPVFTFGQVFGSCDVYRQIVTIAILVYGIEPDLCCAGINCGITIVAVVTASLSSGIAIPIDIGQIRSAAILVDTVVGSFRRARIDGCIVVVAVRADTVGVPVDVGQVRAIAVLVDTVVGSFRRAGWMAESLSLQSGPAL